MSKSKTDEIITAVNAMIESHRTQIDKAANLTAIYVIVRLPMRKDAGLKVAFRTEERSVINSNNGNR